ncbi:conserved Plasmodium protein, unknown function [Plasmodium ovale]|uniref:RAP domain-containing protein n=2 Tax=Plasmodium ovale TaxID=36330 RepID=A0A1A8VJL7_PLAOA|nr:conserved Plasmodium protein, unknown function [Plasmodium ovale curtisi]SBS80709.1 conserved Plasmodium protein, unknown function [Plasmodium ovale curtisi]SCA48256.1 conserved Plasmodium protein, unknown function [Plasmodium ovale]
MNKLRLYCHLQNGKGACLYGIEGKLLSQRSYYNAKGGNQPHLSKRTSGKGNYQISAQKEHSFYAKGISQKDESAFRLKSDIVNLINRVKAQGRGDNWDGSCSAGRSDCSSGKDEGGFSLFFNVLLHLRQNEERLFHLKEKYVIGFLWSFSKVIKFVEKDKILNREGISNMKYHFFHFASLIIKKNYVQFRKNNHIDVKQFIFSVLSVNVGDDDVKKLGDSGFWDARLFVKHLRGGEANGKTSKYDYSSAKSGIGRIGRADTNRFGGDVQGKVTEGETIIPFGVHHPPFKSILTHVNTHISEQLNVIPLDTKTTINFLELSNKNMSNDIKEKTRGILLGKFETGENDIRDFSIFELCRFVNIIVNGNIMKTDNTILPVIIQTLLHEQVYIKNDNAYDFNEVLLNSYPFYSINKTKCIHIKGKQRNCYKWLYSGSKRDIASLVRDFSRMNIQNYYLYHVLIKCFFFKMRCKENDPFFDIHQIGKGNNSDEHKNYGNAINTESVYAKPSISMEEKTVDSHGKGHLLVDTHLIKVKREEQHKLEKKRDLSEKQNKVSISQTMCSPRSRKGGIKNGKDFPYNRYFQEEEKRNKWTEQYIHTFEMSDVRNCVDILIGLGNINYYYDNFVQFFIKNIVQKEPSFFFYNSRNVPNVVLAVRNLLLLGYNHLPTIQKLLKHIIKNHDVIEIKQLVMIFYSIYHYIVKRHQREGVKYFGNCSPLFSAFGSAPTDKSPSDGELRENICGDEKNITMLRTIRNSLFEQLHQLEHIIFLRREEIDSMQGLVNFYFSLANSINTLTIEKYNFFYQKFWSIIKERGKEQIQIETIVQTFMLHYKNNVVHKRLMMYLLDFLGYPRPVDFRNLCTLAFISYHFNIINKSFFLFCSQEIFREIKLVEEGRRDFGQRTDFSPITKGEEKERKGTHTHFSLAESSLNMHGTSFNDPKNDLSLFSYSNHPLGNESGEINQPNSIFEPYIVYDIYNHDEGNSKSEDCGTGDLFNKVIKCVWSLVLSSYFLESSLSTFFKICILLKKMFRNNMRVREDEYYMAYQISLGLNMYYKKNNHLFKKIKLSSNIPVSFYIPYCIVKESVRRHGKETQKKVHISSFQYKISDYFNMKRITYKSEHSLKRDVIVDFLVFKNDKPHLIVEIDGIYHYNVSNDVENGETTYNSMLLVKNGRTVFRDNVLQILYHLNFVSVPWFFFLQPRAFKQFENLLRRNVT